jgi:branched-chain amino acid transport system substrate-binding protein
LGRPVKLVYYDDQSNPATVPGIFTKLLDLDKVDLVIGPYGTAQIAPAMPIIIQRKKVFIALFGLAVNSEFKYPNYFSMIPNGPDPKVSAIKGFFDLAMEQNPKPQTLAIVSADQEYSRNASDGAREIIQKLNLKIVYDRTYPPSTTDFAPIVRAIRATNPDILEINSYPPDSVGMVRAINESGYKPKMVGGGLVGLQATALKTLLGPALNGFVNYDFWLPVAKLDFPGVADLMKRYQARAVTEGVDALGYYMAPYAYAQLQALQAAIEATKSIDDKKLADYMRANTFRAVVGNVRFGPDGEWAQSRTLQVQFHDIKGNDVEQFRTMGTQTVLAPAEYASGTLIYPFEKAR